MQCLHAMLMYLQTMIDWLLTVMRGLQQEPHDSWVDNGRRMVSVLSIIMCFYNLMQQHLKMDILINEDIALMLSMLTIHPDVSQRLCLDFAYVCQCIKPPGPVKKSLADATVSFCIHLHHKTLLNTPQWLYAVPVLHFFQGVSQPFEKDELDPKKMKWGDSSLDLCDLRQQTYDGDVK